MHSTGCNDGQYCGACLNFAGKHFIVIVAMIASHHSFEVDPYFAFPVAMYLPSSLGRRLELDCTQRCQMNANVQYHRFFLRRDSEHVFTSNCQRNYQKPIMLVKFIPIQHLEIATHITIGDRCKMLP